MTALDFVQVRPLMELSQGRAEIIVALIDGPAALNLPDFGGSNIREIPGKLAGSCSRADTMACTHGTLVAAMLAARRSSVAPGICPGCTLLLRPIFAEAVDGHESVPSVTPGELGEALVDAVDAGAQIINLSAALIHQSPKGEHKLTEALNYAAHYGVITVAAAGNQGTVGSSVITRHPWVVPVVACDLQGRPLSESNLSGSIGTRGLSAPGNGITSLGTDGNPHSFSGTSAATPFVTGALALVWSEFPNASASEVKLAMTRRGRQLRKTLVPPVLDAWAAYEFMAHKERIYA